ncbi:DUF4381 domain-containing protein [Kangiella shandongensis]|uniref:DUF4381 domain-containing protein n=1 Tax=Kangiella shandongensis TaxID=2763258 RepID=UPI001CC05AC0|nr:DUF4381 domain-containing protein [Kangiella shandongensis]
MNNAATNSKQQTQLLEQLRDVHAPATVDWWPLAPGWWVIIGLVILLAVLFAIKLYLKKRYYRYSRLAIAELEQLKTSHEPRWLAKAQNIMRRVSLCYLPPQDIKQLAQTEWQELLRATNNRSLSEQTLEAFVDLPYKPARASSDLNRVQVLNEVIDWTSQLPVQSKRWPLDTGENDDV